ncbi:MAG: tetratricopeptide repeat protein, partial [Ruminiclostridium sp.]|nr:tetratricopeptide repeat protein [Ruminiclostridium sp.]
DTGYFVSTEDGISGLAEACLSVYKDAPEDMDEYMMLYTTQMLRRSKKRAHKKAYDEVCSNFVYLSKLEALGGSFEKSNAFSQAIKYYTELSEIFKYLKNTYPENPGYLRDYSISLANVAGIYEFQNDHNKALDLYYEALEILRQLKDTYPGNPDYLHDYSKLLLRVAGIYEVQNDLNKAMVLYKEVLEIQKKLKDTYPENPDYLNCCTISLILMCRVTGSQEYFDEALSIAKKHPELPASKQILHDFS